MHTALVNTSESLHVCTAMQEGKKKLFISPVITNLPHKSFTDYECASVREVLHAKCRYKQDELFETYVEAALSPARVRRSTNLAIENSFKCLK